MKFNAYGYNTEDFIECMQIIAQVDNGYDVSKCDLVFASNVLNDLIELFEFYKVSIDTEL